MMLGKRGRPPVKRTTSMTEFTLGNSEPLDPHNSFINGVGAPARPPRRNSADFAQTTHFLRVCSLCEKRLIPDHDIYMYRGDSAFCSSECRQQQMAKDDKGCSLSKKDAVGEAP